MKLDRTAMKIINSGIIAGSHPQTDRQSCAFPGICITSTGRWICTFRAGPTKAAMPGQHVLLSFSDDCGSSWSEAFEPFTAPPLKVTPGVLRTGYLTATREGTLLAVICWVDHSDPARPFYNDATEGLLDTRICLARSTDDGAHWSPAEFIDTPQFAVPTPLTGPILELSTAPRGGRLACQFELNKHYHDPAPWRHRSVLLFSSDGGRSWRGHVITSDDPALRTFYWDQRPAVVGPDELLDLFWTFDRTAGTYLNIHARRSTNGGQSWSSLWDTNVPGQPAPPVRLCDGRLAMVFVDRTGAPAIKIRTSSDEGHRWPAATELTLFEQPVVRESRGAQSMDEAWSEMYGFALGLPTTARLPDGDVLVVFYAGPSGDATDIRWARIHP